ncbi:MAG: MATE family efflux transporter [Christensenellales bacterium]
MHLSFPLVREIVALGLSGFIVNVTNSGVQIVCNATLKLFGGDVYVGAMTIINSLREVAFAPINGLTGAAQPVLGFNYGAKEYARVRQGIKFMSILCVSYTTFIWLCLLIFPRPFIGIFTSDATLLTVTVPAMHIYFFGFFMMALQMSGQTAAVGLGCSKQAIFFSLLRKAFIVIPLTLILPRLLGGQRSLLAEPISILSEEAHLYHHALYDLERIGAKRTAIQNLCPCKRRVNAKALKKGPFLSLLSLSVLAYGDNAKEALYVFPLDCRRAHGFFVPCLAQCIYPAS